MHQRAVSDQETGVLTMLTRSLWSCTLNFWARKAAPSGFWPGRMGSDWTRNLSLQLARSGPNSFWATSTSFTWAVSPGATARENHHRYRQRGPALWDDLVWGFIPMPFGLTGAIEKGFRELTGQNLSSH